MISEEATIREALRTLYQAHGQISSRVAKGKETEGIKFKDYFEWQEPVAKTAGHRLLAMLRGENEGFLKLTITPGDERALQLLETRYIRNRSTAAAQVRLALEDGWKRLLAPSLETEIRGLLKEKADEEAVRVFADNIRELLMAPPLGEKSVLAIDPGIRTGCKVVCLDRQGKLLFHTVIYLMGSANEKAAAVKIVTSLVEKYQIEAIAIGNGTAGRETELFVKSLPLPREVCIMLVNESGASIYSASDVAREEFPDQDITVRGAVSIGRRLMDPLAELVKIDPKSIGVGQYQHDVHQGKLKTSLDDVVMSCVNAVGVEVNTASRQLLTYVSGLGPQLAKNLVAHREANGPFPDRTALKKVPRLGPKAFEQCAGFLRIRDSKNPLDHSAVHPESYAIVKKMAADVNAGIPDLMKDANLRQKIDLKRYVTDSIGLPTLQDILAELAKPGRDPRRSFEVFAFAEDIHTINDLQPGQKLPGIVTNVTKFGAFIDIGVHQDGLVHISELADHFVKDPNAVVKVHQKVQVTVLEVDIARRRIALSLKSKPGSLRRAHTTA
jgi:uncharacterized protein